MPRAIANLAGGAGATPEGLGPEGGGGGDAWTGPVATAAAPRKLAPSVAFALVRCCRAARSWTLGRRVIGLSVAAGSAAKPWLAAAATAATEPWWLTAGSAVDFSTSMLRVPTAALSRSVDGSISMAYSSTIEATSSGCSVTGSVSSGTGTVTAWGVTATSRRAGGATAAANGNSIGAAIALAATGLGSTGTVAIGPTVAASLGDGNIGMRALSADAAALQSG